MNQSLPSPTLAVLAGFRRFAVFLAGWLRLLRIFRSREEVALAEWFESYVAEVFRRLEIVLAQPPVPEGVGPRPVRARGPVARTPSAGLPRGPSYGCSYEYYDAPADDGEVCAVPRRAVVLRRGFAGSVIPRLVPCVRPCGPDSIFRVMGRGAELCPICFYFESMGGFQTKLLVDRLLMFWKVNCVPSERAMISSFPENVAPASALAASLAP